jgi:two-component system chemotaxis response regulator CheB
MHVKPLTARVRAGVGVSQIEAVAIGASAGGVDVLNGLIAALPVGFAPAVIVVVHVLADTPSYLAQTFSYRSVLPVIEPDAGERVLGGRVHVAPPGYHLMVEDDYTIALSTEAAVRFSRPSIDVMFESAARVYRERLVAVLLSGANDDGVRGLEAVRAHGGRTWVQAPHSAASPAMPSAAIERGAADEILTPSTLARRLAQLTYRSDHSCS